MPIDINGWHAGIADVRKNFTLHAHRPITCPMLSHIPSIVSMLLHMHIFIIIACITGSLPLWITGIITYMPCFKYLLCYFSHQQQMITDDLFINFVSFTNIRTSNYLFFKPLTYSLSLLLRNQLTNTFIFISQKMHFCGKKIQFFCQAFLLVMMSLSSMDQFLTVKVHIPPLTKFCPETPYRVKRSHAKNFQNRNCGFPTIKLF